MVISGTIRADAPVKKGKLLVIGSA